MENVCLVEQSTTAPTESYDVSTPSQWLRHIVIAVAAVLLAVPILAVTIVPAFLSATTRNVLSESMEPVLSPGSIVVTQSVNPDDLRIGDIVTYTPSVEFTPRGVPITHRVIELDRQGDTVVRVLTQGDANPEPDPAITPGQINGRMLYSVPIIGLPGLALHNAGLDGLALAATLGILAYAGLTVFDKRRR